MLESLNYHPTGVQVLEQVCWQWCDSTDGGNKLEIFQLPRDQRQVLVTAGPQQTSLTQGSGAQHHNMGVVCLLDAFLRGWGKEAAVLLLAQSCAVS